MQQDPCTQQDDRARVERAGLVLEDGSRVNIFRLRAIGSGPLQAVLQQAVLHASVSDK